MTLRELTILIRSSGESEAVLKRLEHLRRIEAAFASGKQEKWMEQTAEILAEKKAVLLLQLSELHKANTALNYIIENAPDAHLREVLFQRCLERRTWEGISAKLGGYNSADALKKQVARYIKAMPFPPAL